MINVYRCVHQEQVGKYLRPQLNRLVLDIINEEIGEMTVKETDKEFVVRIYSYVFVGVMLDWIKEDMQIDPKQITD